MGMLSGFAEGLNTSFQAARQKADARKLLGLDEDLIAPAPQEGSADTASTDKSVIPSVPVDPSAISNTAGTLGAVGADALKTKFPMAWKVAQAIGAVESNGNYNASGPTVHGQNAMGKYQVMPENLASWSKKALGSSISPEEFKKNPGLQDRIAVYTMQGYLNQGYSPQDVASMWFSGHPLKNNNRTDQATGIAVPDYVDRFNKHYQSIEA